MINATKITIFDDCVNGDLDNFKDILDPMYNQYMRFFKLFKDTFKDREDSVETIIFKKDDKVATFHVVCNNNDDIEITNTDKHTTIIKNGKDICFHVHPNKG